MAVSLSTAVQPTWSCWLLTLPPTRRQAITAS